MTLTETPPAVAASDNQIRFGFNTGRSVTVDFDPNHWETVVNSIPPAGSYILVLGFRFDLFIGGADPFNPFQVELSGAATPTDVALILMRAFADCARLSERCIPSYDGAGPSVGLRNISTWENLNVRAFDPSNVQYVAPTDPLYPSAASVGIPQVLRQAYRMVLEVLAEDHHNSDTAVIGSYDSAGRLTRPALQAQTPFWDAGASQNYLFQVQDLLLPILAFDVPDPNVLKPVVMYGCIKRYFVRWAERYADDAQAFKWNFEDRTDVLFGTVGYEARGKVYRVLNASMDFWESMRRLTNNVEGCAIGLTDGDSLKPYFGDIPRRFLTLATQKRTWPGAPEYLAFWTGEAFHEYFLEYTIYRHNGTIEDRESTLDLSDYASCFYTGGTLTNQLLLLPVHWIWQETGFLSASKVCVRVQSRDFPLVFPDGTSGTFEGPDVDGMLVSVPPIGATYTLTVSSIYARSGLQSLRYQQVIVLPDDTGAVITHSTPITLEPGKYRLTWWIYVVQADMVPNSLIGQIQAAGFTGGGSITTSSSNWELGVSPFNDWFPIIVDIENNGTTDSGTFTFTVGDFGISVLGDVDIYMDDITLTRLGEPITEWFTYNIETGCSPKTSFLFQNRLGVPDTWHLFADTTDGLEVERLYSEQEPLGNVRGREFQKRQFKSTSKRTFEAETQWLREPDLPGFEQLMVSNRVYLWETVCPPVNACTGLQEDGADVPPMLGDFGRYALYFPEDLPPPGTGYWWNVGPGDCPDTPGGFLYTFEGSDLPAYLEFLAGVLSDLNSQPYTSATTGSIMGYHVVLVSLRREPYESFVGPLCGQPLAYCCSDPGVFFVADGTVACETVALDLCTRRLTPLVLTTTSVTTSKTNEHKVKASLKFEHSRSQDVNIT